MNPSPKAIGAANAEIEASIYQVKPRGHYVQSAMDEAYQRGYLEANEARRNAESRPAHLCCAVCQRKASTDGVALERVSVTGKGAKAIWLCHDHLKRDIGFQAESRQQDGPTTIIETHERT